MTIDDGRWFLVRGGGLVVAAVVVVVPLFLLGNKLLLLSLLVNLSSCSSPLFSPEAIIWIIMGGNTLVASNAPRRLDPP